MIRHDKCPLCGSPRISKALSATDHTVSGESFGIWQCAHCCFRFTQDAPAAENIGRYYESEEYISHTEKKTGFVNHLYMYVRRITLRQKKNFVTNHTGLATGRLLDVGAGTGAFLDCMARAGWAVEGVEPAESAIQKAASTYGLRLKETGTLFESAEPEFDAITLWHVLEHVHELHRYFEQLKRRCKPGGRIFIAVPNFTSYDAEHYGGGWAAYDVPRHLYHFSPASMNVLIEKHGCRLEGIYPMWFDSFYVSMLSEKYRKSSLSFLRGLWCGLQSNLSALKNRKKASSVIYVISPQ